MNTKAVIRVVPADKSSRGNEPEWLPPVNPIVVGKDVLELLSTSMYVDPMTIYREYIQNAADAIDEARDGGDLKKAKVQINITPESRSIRIRDNGVGLPWKLFPERLMNIGASTKRGTSARGFRGVGRLAGLGYCQSLIFRSRKPGEDQVSEMRWDCRSLRSVLRSADISTDLAGLIKSVVTLRQVRTPSVPERFFEVELQGVVRHRNDRLLSPEAVHDYLGQVAPVPFHPDFRFGEEIEAALKPHVTLGNLYIHIDDSDEPIYRPHRNHIEGDNGKRQRIKDLEVRSLTGSDGELGAIAWLLHHEYVGAIPTSALVKGIRFRVGNIQVGDTSLLEDLFPEPRFNAWAVGEVHVIDKKLLANGRRDHFEQSTHLDNLFNQLAPIARDIAKRCRQSSLSRKWAREFELHRDAAFEKAKIIARGGLSKIARQHHADGVAKSLQAMRKAIGHRYVPEELRDRLTAEASAVEARVTKLLGSYASARDPLERFRPEVRGAYRRVIDLIYQCSSNRSAAAVLVEKILGKLTESSEKSRK
jgi:molecular chaperone HtpG